MSGAAPTVVEGRQGGLERFDPTRGIAAAEPRPLHALVVYDCVYPDAHGGIEHRNFEVAMAMARRGHRTTLAGWTARPEEPCPGVRTLPLRYRTPLYGPSGRRQLTAAARLTAAVARLDLSPFDLVETANIPYLHLPLLAVRCRLAGKPLVISWYEYWGRYWQTYVGGLLWPLHAGFERACVGLGTAVNAVSALTGGRLHRVRGGPEVPIVPGGIPFERIRIAAAEGAMQPGPPLLYTGRLQREKRLDLLLRAVSLIPRDQDGPLLTLVGGGPDRDRLEQLTGELGISDRVVFRGRLESSADVWRELGRARIAVQPSSREGFGLFPLEAMAAGLPVVHCASDESAVIELVRHGREGLWVPATADELATALTELLDDEAELARMAGNAIDRARQYDWDLVAERLEALWAGVVDRDRS